MGIQSAPIAIMNCRRFKSIAKIFFSVASIPLFIGIQSSSTDAASGRQEVLFTLNAFGDSGYAQTHTSPSKYTGGFLQSYKRFDRTRSHMADINYLNWETSVGDTCEIFWSKSSPGYYAFLTSPTELRDAINHGFNLIGLANNHTFDCLYSKHEGSGPQQTLYHLRNFSKPGIAHHLTSGVHLNKNKMVVSKNLSVNGYLVPVAFTSIYAGGNDQHCRYINCLKDINKIKEQLSNSKGIRIVSMHSWDRGSHSALKKVFRSLINSGLADLAIGTGPHIAENVEILHGPRGKAVLATSLGNFIHPSLAAQPYNIILKTKWSLNPSNLNFRLKAVALTKVACDAEECVARSSKSLY